MINLISDTVTKPTGSMLRVMFEAEVGDDVFGEDPTVNALQEQLAAMFGMEAGLFCPSGTMTNQIAIKCHTNPLDEIICEGGSHVYQYETGGYAFNSGVAVRLIEGEYGKLTALQVAEAARPLHDWLPNTRLVVIENTTNRGGGSYYTMEEMERIAEVCREQGWAFHLDGARIFHALVETGDSPGRLGQIFDSISVCLSKGLGAPVGSVLLGSRTMIDQARRYRKVMGGGMRQAGYLAAAGLYAINHHVDRLKEDHRRARKLAAALEACPYVSAVKPVHTNIVIFDLQAPRTASDFIDRLENAGVKASAFGPFTVRFVTHLDVTDAMIDRVVEVLEGLK